MTEISSSSLYKVSYVLKGLATVFTGLLVLYAYFLPSSAFINVGLFGTLAITTMFDSFVVDGTNYMTGLGLNWRRHFLPAVAVMHAGAVSIILTLDTSSYLLPFLTGGVFIIGFLWCANQYFTMSDVNAG